MTHYPVFTQMEVVRTLPRVSAVLYFNDRTPRHRRSSMT